MTYILRDARKEEAKELAILINHAGTGPRNNGIDIVGWAEAAEQGEGPFDYGARIVSSEDDMFSYNNIRVLETDGKIAAMACCFEAFERSPEQMELIPEQFRVFKELTSTIPGEFYLDSIAVLPEFRGHKFGQAMLEDCVEKAGKQGYSSVYLIAFAENVPGVRMYEKNGFKKVETRMSNGHPDMPYTGDVVLYKRDI